MFSNEYVKQRMAKAEKLKEAGINPYGHYAKRNTKIADFLEQNKDIFELENKRDENRKFIVAGRVKFLRLMGKAAFFKIEDESGILQVYMSKNDLGDKFNLLKKNLEVGDIVEVSGYPFVTKTGELVLLF